MAEYLFYRAQAAPAKAIAIDSGYTFEIWRPTLSSVVPNGLPLIPFGVWWLFHQLRIFKNRDYALFLVRHDGVVVHRSVITPGYFRFPFMGANDLQVGDTFTEPAHRGKGLALFALQAILGADPATRRPYWYVVERTNRPSIRVVEKAGFQLAAEGVRSSRFGLRAAGSYVITRHLANAATLA